MAIFPAVFAFGAEPAVGPGLLFITIPTVTNTMPLGGVVMVAFLVLTAIAATGAMLSLFEVPVAYLAEKTRLTRTQATVITAVLLALIGSTAALSSSTLANVKIFGKTFFDLWDYLSSNLMLPIGGFFICVPVGWFGRSAMPTNKGTLNNERVVKFFYGIAVRDTHPGAGGARGGLFG